MAEKSGVVELTLEQYQHEYGRLLGWRERWCRLSNKHERGRLESRQEAIERRARIANQAIGALINRFDKQQSRPYESGVLALLKDCAGLYRQDIFDRLCTPGRTNSAIVSSAIQRLEREGSLRRQHGPCSTHKGPLYLILE